MGNASYVIEGADPSAFSISEGSTWSGKDGILNVTFTPTALRSYSAVLKFSNPDQKTKTITLYGQGIPPSPVMTVDPTSIAFGDVVSNTTSSIPLNVTGSNMTGDISYVLSGSEASAFTITQTSWDSKAGGTLNITFAPTGVAPYNAMITISGPGVANKTVHLSGNGINSSTTTGLVVSSNRLSFDIVLLDRTSSLPVDISGRALTGNISYALSGTDASAFRVTETSWNVATGGTLNIGFTPTESKNYTATLTISTPGFANEIIELAGIGARGIPRLQIDETNIFFPSSVQTFSAVVWGSDLLEDISYELTGPDAAFFTVQENAWNRRAGGVLSFNFRPAEPRLYRAALEITSAGAGTHTITLEGTYLSVNTAGLSFGDAVIFTTTAPQVLTITGGSTYEMESYGSDDKSAFSIVDDTWDSETGVRRVSLVFHPTQPKDYDATFTVWRMYESRTVRLRGKGVETLLTPSLVVDREMLTFSEAVKDQATAAQTVHVSGSNLTGSISYALSGNDASAFTVSGTSWNAASGGALGITFTPTESKIYREVTLTISSPGAATKTVRLQGAVKSTPAYLQIEPTGISFGNHEMNTVAAARSLTVSGVNLTGTISYTLGGTDPSAFTINESSWNAATGGTLNVTFNPTAKKAYAAMITVTTPGASRTVVLTGSGVEAGAEFIPVRTDDIPFGNTETNKTAEPYTVQVPNVSQTSTIEYVLDGPDASAFTVNSPVWVDDETGWTLNVLFTPTEEKVYNATLIISSGGSEYQVLYLTGKGENLKVPTVVDAVNADNIKVYPNPTTDRITIEIPGQCIGKPIEIYNIYGVLVSNSKVTGVTTTIDLSSFVKGTYIVRINGKTFKVLKI